MSDEQTLLTDDLRAEETTAEGETEAHVVQEEAGQPEAEAAKPEAEVVPEQYEFKAPEGMEYDPETMKLYAEAAREAGLSQEKADLILGKVAPYLAQQQQAAVAQAREQWATDSRADKEFGGDALQQNLAVAVKAMEQFGTPELKDLLNQSGLGNHPEVIRVFYRAGKALMQDGFVVGKGVSETGSDARSHFPNSNMNP